MKHHINQFLVNFKNDSSYNIQRERETVPDIYQHLVPTLLNGWQLQSLWYELIVCIYNTDKVKLVGDKVTIVEWFLHWFGKIMKMINDDSDEDVDLQLDNLSLPSDDQQTQSVTAG